MTKSVDITVTRNILGIIILASGSTIATNSVFGPGGDYQNLVTAQASSEARSEERWIAYEKAETKRQEDDTENDRELNRILTDGFAAITKTLEEGSETFQDMDRQFSDLRHANAIKDIRDAQQDAVIEALTNMVEGILAKIETANGGGGLSHSAKPTAIKATGRESTRDSRAWAIQCRQSV